MSKKARDKRALKQLRTIAEILMRKLPQQSYLECYQQDCQLYERILKQQLKDTDKFYSLHEPQVYYGAKRKGHKQYEYGSKASIACTAQSNGIVGVVSHEQH